MPEPIGQPELVEWIDEETWEDIVRNVPIVSVDLVVLVDGGVALAKRQNHPAKGEWFVPGGRVHKGEMLKDTVDRIAYEEFGIKVEIVESLGAFQHLYDESDISDSGGKHYFANGFVVKTTDKPTVSDDQHGSVRVFSELPENLHAYIEAYFRDSETLEARFFGL